VRLCEGDTRMCALHKGGHARVGESCHREGDDGCVLMHSCNFRGWQGDHGRGRDGKTAV
jgi:hypothetical protein